MTDEAARLTSLHGLHVLDTPPEASFDDLVLLAGRIAGTPIALISLVDEGRQWFKARTGLDVPSTGRDISFCDRVVRTGSTLEVADARLDPRYSDNPLVTGEPHVVFYAGFPLIIDDGLVLGTLCVIDRVPRVLTAEQREGLRVLAFQVTTQLRLRRQTRLLEEQLERRREEQRELLLSRHAHQLLAEHSRAVLDSVDVGIVACDAGGRLTLFNPTTRVWHGLPADTELSPEQWSGHFDLYHPDGTTLLAPHEIPLTRALTEGTVAGVEMVIAPRDLPRRRVRCDGRALRGEQGEVLGAVVAMTDVTGHREALATVARERRRLSEAQRIGLLGSFEYDPRSRLLTASDQLLRIWGVEGPFAPTSDGRELIVDEDRPAAVAAFAGALREGGRHDFTFRILRGGDGAVRHIRCVMEVDGAELDDGVLEVHGTHQDVTELTLVEREAKEAHAFLDAVMTASPDFTFVTDLATGAVLFGSRTTPLGLTGEQLTRLGAAAATELVHPDDLPSLHAANIAAADLGDGEVLQLRYRARHVNGAWLWMVRRVTPFRRDAAGHVTQVTGVLRDITAVVEAENRLVHAARHDHLTGLPNRALLNERLDEALVTAGRSGREVAVLFIDLDGFKRVNDTAGHGSGDAVLVQTARRIQGALRPEDTVARVGGDEFVVVAAARDRGEPSAGPSPDEALRERTLALRLAERITEAVAQPILLGGSEFAVTASIGVSFASGGDDPGAVTAEQLMQDADTAMYEAKARGKDGFVVYDNAQSGDRQRRGHIERELRWALGGNDVPEPDQTAGGPGLHAVYQPIFGPEGRLAGFEALARFRDRSGVQHPTDLVVQIAEDCGLIRTLGTRMLDTALCQLATWRAAHPGACRLHMSVNVSAVQAQHPDLVREVEGALARHGVTGSDLVLELTETALLHANPVTMASLHRLRADGVDIVIDDFGVGYASLTYLTTLPVTGVKIDRSFTSGLPDSVSKTLIVKAVAALSADLGLACVAEGVETHEQYAALPAGLLVQGYLLARPAPAAELDLAALLAVVHRPRPAPLSPRPPHGPRAPLPR